MAPAQMSRKKLWMMIAVSYVAITALAADLLYRRHVNEMLYPGEASSGMNAAGDAMMLIVFSFLYLVPTVLVLRLLSDNIPVYWFYSYVLLLISLTAPIALVVLVLDSMVKAHVLEGAALNRLFCSPFVLVLAGVSRWITKSNATRKLLNYALVMECVSLVIALMLLFFS